MARKVTDSDVERRVATVLHRYDVEADDFFVGATAAALIGSSPPAEALAFPEQSIVEMYRQVVARNAAMHRDAEELRRHGRL